ncbi:MAG: hypothetical protein ACO398_04230 [Kiritimatiellia bacterium]
MAIKEVLQDEMESSLLMEENYVRRLEQLPKGNLIKKTIKGREYWYLQIRDGQKVRFDYIKKPSAAMIIEYAKAKESRKQYRRLLAQVRLQIKQIRKMLKHGKSV